MHLNSRIKLLLEYLTGSHIYRSLPRGIDIAHDIKTSLSILHTDIVFDIGANIGSFSRYILTNFCCEHIYCFEPVRSTFKKLHSNFKSNNIIKCHQIAIGSYTGTGKMILQGSPDMFFLQNKSFNTNICDNSPTETVEVITLDEFSKSNGINHIHYLKIDTEGGDLDVLKGSVRMLTEHNIDILQVEAGMNPNNKQHVPFHLLNNFLEQYKYYLFGIYEQTREWPTKKPHLRRVNAVFISQKLIDHTISQ